MTSPGTVTIETPTDRVVVLTRRFDAPRDLVFDALTRSDLLERWMRAPGRTLEICEVDLKVGGAYRFVFRGPGKKDVGVRGTYREVVPTARIVTTEAWEDWDAGETWTTTLLAEQGGKTTLTTRMLFPSQEVRDTVLKSGLERGVTEDYDRLVELLASMQARGDSARDA